MRTKGTLFIIWQTTNPLFMFMEVSYWYGLMVRYKLNLFYYSIATWSVASHKDIGTSNRSIIHYFGYQVRCYKQCVGIPRFIYHLKPCSLRRQWKLTAHHFTPVKHKIPSRWCCHGNVEKRLMTTLVKIICTKVRVLLPMFHFMLKYLYSMIIH